MFDEEAGHRRPPEKPCRLHPAMAGQDRLLGVDQHRVQKAEGLDAGRDLLQLLSRMFAGVSRPGLEFTQGDLGRHGKDTPEAAGAPDGDSPVLHVFRAASLSTAGSGRPVCQGIY